MTDYTPVIAVDFDGVIHRFTTPWTASTIVADPPVDGAFAWLRMLLGSGVRVWLHTSRMTRFAHPWSAVTPELEEPIEARVRALHEWFRAHGGGDIMEHPNINLWQWPGKPQADWYVDDHAVRFDGVFPTHDELFALRTPWNKAEPHLASKAEAERVALIQGRRPVTQLEHDRLVDRVKLLEDMLRALEVSVGRHEDRIGRLMASAAYDPDRP